MNKTALIVDDSRSAQVLLKRVLETHELNVDTAESAEDALDYLIATRPDVIFMDHLMPGMDGFEAVSAIKQNPATATIPIMMYTSQEGEVYVGQARALGAVGVLPKKVAPVEVSKVLKSLHIIDDEKQEQAGEAGPPGNQGTAESSAIQTLNRDLRTLIQDLFEQQQAVLRRELFDSHEAIASRLADAVQPPSAEDTDEAPAPPDRASSGFIHALVLVLTVSTMLFAWLYLNREQNWQETLAQNVQLQRALESRPSAGAEESLRALQQIGDYRQSLDAMYAATIGSLEWGANQASEYHFGELPLGDHRLEIVTQLTEQLQAINFAGVVRIETHVADYCLMIDGTNGYAAAEDLMVTDCDTIGVPLEEAYAIGLGQSAAFANFIQSANESGGRIRYEINSLGNSAPLVDYPATIDGVSASAWNQIAAANNRVEITVVANIN